MILDLACFDRVGGMFMDNLSQFWLALAMVNKNKKPILTLNTHDYKIVRY